jgi:hypothetical protein
MFDLLPFVRSITRAAKARMPKDPLTIHSHVARFITPRDTRIAGSSRLQHAMMISQVGSKMNSK